MDTPYCAARSSTSTAVGDGVWGKAEGCGGWSVGEGRGLWGMECGGRQRAVGDGLWGKAEGCGQRRNGAEEELGGGGVLLLDNCSLKRFGTRNCFSPLLLVGCG